MTLLTIRGLTKTYPNGTRALDGVDLDIPRGVFGLLGPNGAGKSSLMRTIATLQDADAGSIHFDGIDALREPRRVQEILGYLPQEFGVYPRVGAQALLDHLAVLKGITHRRTRKDQVKELLVRTNLWEHRRKPVDSFSGGMRRRFGIAQALLGAPRLLIVDEPTAGLDPEERQRFLDLITELGEDIAVILSTHWVEDVRELCPQMAVLDGGRILRAGSPEEAIQELEGRLWRRRCERDEVQRLEQEVHVLSTRRRAGQVVLHALAEQCPAGFEAVEPRLEDAYFAALKRRG
ncbi:MAG: ABC-type multidrug transport system ATPase subunit [Planctomycetota bacterium]|jgi:ABC-type multidrug transport system ATPase subunit